MQEAATELKRNNNTSRKDDKDKTVLGAEGTSNQFDNIDMEKNMDNPTEHE